MTRTTLTISKYEKTFIVDDKRKSGSPLVGYGRTMKEAIGDYTMNHQGELGIKFDLDDSALPAERRRQRELAKR